ncbi:MAG TPA: hypothetical protein VGI87_14065 [Solirubrobacteraceae bacterium]
MRRLGFKRYTHVTANPFTKIALEVPWRNGSAIHQPDIITTAKALTSAYAPMAR